MPIKGLSEARRIPRLGKIHLGRRHPEKGYPMKTNYFVCPPEVVAVYGDEPKELPILIPVEDEEKWCSQYYRCYSKTRGLVCKGDGEVALRMIDTKTGAMADRDSKDVEMRESSCAGRECPDYKVKCKEVMNLQFLLPNVPGLGVWQIDTSSINSIRNINSTAELIKSIYKRIHMIPLYLTLEPIEVNNPETKKLQTVYVLNLRVKEKLADLAIEARKQSTMYQLPPGDDERPELISPEYEPDVVEMPEGLVPLTPENVEDYIEKVWGDELPKKEKLVEPKKEVVKPESNATASMKLYKAAVEADLKPKGKKPDPIQEPPEGESVAVEQETGAEAPFTTEDLLNKVCEKKGMQTHKQARGYLIGICKVTGSRIDKEPQAVWDEVGAML